LRVYITISFFASFNQQKPPMVKYFFTVVFIHYGSTLLSAQPADETQNHLFI